MPATDPPASGLGPAASGQVPVREDAAPGTPDDLGKTALGYSTPHTLMSGQDPQAGSEATAPGGPPEPGSPPAPVDFKQTMLGMAPGTVSPHGAPKGNLKQTMVGGMGAAGPAAPQAPDPAGQAAFNQTMLGGVARAAPASEPAAGPSGAFKQTMLGGMTPDANAQGAMPAAPGSKQTMLGMAPAGTSPQAPPAGAVPNHGLGGTYVQFDASQPAQPPAPAQQSHNLAGTQVQFDAGHPHPAAPATNPSLAGTQVQFAGGAGPGTPAAPATATPDPRATQVQFDRSHPTLGSDHPSTGTLALDPPAGAPAAAGGTSEKKTVLGVAVPGIAPINPGQAKPSSNPPPAAVPMLPPSLPAPARSGLSVVILMVLGLVATGAVVLAILYVIQKPESITARVTADEQGDEQLELSCKECPEGTIAKLDARQATFKKNKAVLPLTRPLKIGENPVTVSVTKPGKGAETFPLTVPVQFRVKGDLSGVEKNPPTVAVLVEALPGTAAVVDGKALTLDEEGKGRYELDISEEVSGESATVEPLEKSVPYTLTPPEGQPVKGEITLKTGIAALIVDAPGPSIVIEDANFMLAGNTQRGGSVSVAGRPITVDPEGRFAQLMSVSSVGETTIAIRANAEKHAPRLVPIRIRRVDSLDAEAKRLRSSARTSFTDFAQDPDKSRGSEVLVEAKVIESRTDRHTTIMLIAVTTGCPSDSCLARVVYGAKINLKRDQKVTISGIVQGAVEGPRTGSRVPEIRADFVVEN